MFPISSRSFLNILLLGSCYLIPLDKAGTEVTNELHAAGPRILAPGRISLASSAASAVGPFPPHSASWPSSHLAGCSSWTPLLVPSSRLTSGCCMPGAQSWTLCPFLSTLTPMETSSSPGSTCCLSSDDTPVGLLSQSPTSLLICLTGISTPNGPPSLL